MSGWFSASELAAMELPGLPRSKRNVSLMAQRQGWTDKKDPVLGALARRRSGRGGGMVFHASLLPAKAQAKLAAETSGPGIDASPEAVRREIWDRYEALPTKHKDKAKVRLVALDRVLSLEASLGRRDHAVNMVAKESGHSARSIYNWLKACDGLDRGDWLPALAPSYVGGGKRAELPAEGWDYVKSLYLTPERRGFNYCYKELTKRAAQEGWSLPTCSALKRRLDKEVDPVVVKLARYGADAARAMHYAQERDRSHFHALEAVNADGHKFDVFVEFEDGTVGRPIMTAIQDLYSGLFVAYRVDHSENAAVFRLAVGDMVERFGIPSLMYLDNGRNFASKVMTGGMPHRFRGKIMEEEPAGVLKTLGVEVHFTTPYSGQSKPIERAFRDLCEQVSKHPAFHGAWTGNSPENKPENYGSRAVPIEKFLEVLDRQIDDHNRTAGRRAANCRGRSFAQTFAESYATAPIRKATPSQRRLWLLQSEARKIRPDGTLHFLGNRFFDAALHGFIGKKVTARFDPEQIHDGLHIYDLAGRYIAFAECIEAVGFNDVAAAKAHAKKRREFMRNARDRLDLERRLTPQEVAAIEERVARAQDAPDTDTAASVVRPIFGRPIAAPTGGRPARDLQETRTQEPVTFLAIHDADPDSVIPLPREAKPSFDDDGSFVEWVAANPEAASPEQTAHAVALLRESPALRLLDGVEVLLRRAG